VSGDEVRIAAVLAEVRTELLTRADAFRYTGIGDAYLNAAELVRVADLRLAGVVATARAEGAQTVLDAVEAIHVPAHDDICRACRVATLPCHTVSAARAARSEAEARRA